MIRWHSIIYIYHFYYIIIRTLRSPLAICFWRIYRVKPTESPIDSSIWQSCTTWEYLGDTMTPVDTQDEFPFTKFYIFRRVFRTIMSTRTIMCVNRFGPIMPSPLCPLAHFVRTIMSAGPLCTAHYIRGPIMSACASLGVSLAFSQCTCGNTWKKTARAIASGETTTAFTSPF